MGRAGDETDAARRDTGSDACRVFLEKLEFDHVQGMTIQREGVCFYAGGRREAEFSARESGHTLLPVYRRGFPAEKGDGTLLPGRRKITFLPRRVGPLQLTVPGCVEGAQEGSKEAFTGSEKGDKWEKYG